MDHGERLLPGGVSKRRLPVNFKQGDMGLFAHELRKEIPDTVLMKLDGVIIRPNGLLMRGSKVLPESFPYPTWEKVWNKPKSRLKRHIKGRFFEPTPASVPVAFWVTDTWSHGYFHWMTDVLPRLLTIYEQIGDYPLLIPSQLASVNTVCQSIKLFNIRKLTFVDRPTRCESLWMPSHTAQTGHFNEPHINHLRDLLREHYRANQNSQSEGRIYISRSQAGRRKITNESNCIRILTKYDFEIHNFEEHDFSDQAQIAMNAKYLISNHGAGLTNMLFMKKKGSVLELRKREDGHNNCYFALASALDLHYYYQQCEGTNPDEDPSTADILVDCELLERNIRQMLSQDEKSLS